MNGFAKILLSVVVIVILSPAKISLAQAITITDESYELKFLDSAPSLLGSKDQRIRFNETDPAPARGPSNEPQAHCDLEPQSCNAISASMNAFNSGVSTPKHSMSSKKGTAGSATGFSEPTAIFLLIVGLFGLSRLRGRPIK